MDTVTRKVMAIKKEEDIKSGRVAGLVTGFLWYGGVFSIGITGLCLYGQVPSTILKPYSPTMVNDLLPKGTFCFSPLRCNRRHHVNLCRPDISGDWRHFRGHRPESFNVNMNEKNALIFSKLLLASVGVATFLFALNSGELVMNMVSFAWSGMGSSLGPVVLLTMLDRKASGSGMIAALIAGSGLTLIWGKFHFDGRRREVRCVLHRFVRWHPREQADSE